jgi:uncharacterized protein (TIGR03435 family)
MNRKTALVLLNLGLICVIAPSVLAQGSPSAPSDSAPQFPPSYQVHITPSTLPAGTTSISIAPDTWIARGYDLKSLIAQIYAVDANRIDLPNAAFNDTTYDVALVLPQDESEDQINRLLRKALLTQFNLTVASESRPMDVYVISSPKGPGPALHPHRATETASETQPKFIIQQQVCPGISSAGIIATMGTIPEFSRTLEQYLNQPFVNEAALPDAYDFQIPEFRTKEKLFQLLRDQLGLVVTPSHRNVEILAVYPQQPANVEVGALTPNP